MLQVIRVNPLTGVACYRWVDARGPAPELSLIRHIIQHPSCLIVGGVFVVCPPGGILIALSCIGSWPRLRARRAHLWAGWTSRRTRGPWPLPPGTLLPLH